MGLKDPELGERKRFEIRRGVGGFASWGGINRNTDPSGINPWEFHYLGNVSFDGGSIKGRGGQTVLATSMNDCVVGLIDLGGSAVTAGTLLAVPPAGGGIIVYNNNISPVDQLVAPGTLGSPATTAWSNRRTFYRFGDLTLCYSDAAGAVSKLVVTSVSGVADISVERVFNVTKICGAVEAADGVLYLAQGSTGTGKVYSWNGTTLSTDASGFPVTDTIIAKYHETVVVIGVDFCRKRNSDGTWSSVSMPGGMTSFRPLDARTFLDTLYISGRDEAAGIWDPKILAFNGTSLSVARTPTDGTAGTSGQHATTLGCTALAVFNGFLYFAWARAQINGHQICYLGRTADGASWTDAHFALEGSVSTGAVGALLEYRGSLFIAPLVTYGDDSDHLLSFSTGTTTTSWTEYLSETNGALGTVSAIDMIVVP